MTKNTKSMIQKNLNELMSKASRCDVTIAQDIALLSAKLTYENLTPVYNKSISEEESREFSGKLREYIDLFQTRCSCNK